MDSDSELSMMRGAVVGVATATVGAQDDIASKLARRMLHDARKSNVYSDELDFIVICGKFPSDELLGFLKISQQRLAHIDQTKVENLLKSTCKPRGVASLILLNPSIELFNAVMDEIVMCLANNHQKWYRRLSTYFVGHGARGFVCINDKDTIEINEVIKRLNMPKLREIQRILYFECCRSGEESSIEYPEEGNVAIFYATHPGKISYTGKKDGISGTSDGIPIFTRVFCELVKTFEGSFEEFACELSRLTEVELKNQDSDECQQPILVSHNTITGKEVNLVNKRYHHFQPRNVNVETLKSHSLSENFKVTWELDLPTPPRLPILDDIPVIPPPTLKSLTLEMKYGENWQILMEVDPPENKEAVFSLPCGGKYLIRLAAYFEEIEGPVYSETREVFSELKPVLHVNLDQKWLPPCKNIVKVSWTHTLPPAPVDDGSNVAQLEEYIVKTKLRSGDNQWETPKGIQVNRDNKEALFQLQTPGEYDVRVLVGFSEATKEPVYSEVEQIEVPKRCSNWWCCLSVILLPLFFSVVGFGLVAGLLKGNPTKVTYFQMYEDSTIETSNSLSSLDRYLYSSWNLSECPIPPENPYNNIFCAVFQENEVTKYQSNFSDSNTATCQFKANDRYILYPFRRNMCAGNDWPNTLTEIYMAKGSTAYFELKLSLFLQHTNLLSSKVYIFYNYNDFNNFVLSGKKINVVKMLIPSESVSDRKPPVVLFKYTVQKSSYLYFALVVPINTTLTVTSNLVIWQYNEDWGNRIEYQIDKESNTTIPIDRNHGEVVLCRTPAAMADRTHICVTGVSGKFILMIGGGVFAGIVFIIVTVCVCVIVLFLKAKLCKRCTTCGIGGDDDSNHEGDLLLPPCDDN